MVQCYLCIAATHFSPGIGKKKMDDNTMQTAGLRPWQSSVQRRPSMQCVGHYCTGMRKSMATAFKYCGPCIFFTNEVCQKREKSSHHYLMQLVAVIKWIRQLHYVLSYWIKLWPNLGRWSWRLIIKRGMHRYTNHSVLHNSNIFYSPVRCRQNKYYLHRVQFVNRI